MCGCCSFGGGGLLLIRQVHAACGCCSSDQSGLCQSAGVAAALRTRAHCLGCCCSSGVSEVHVLLLLLIQGQSAHVVDAPWTGNGLLAQYREQPTPIQGAAEHPLPRSGSPVQSALIRGGEATCSLYLLTNSSWVTGLPPFEKTHMLLRQPFLTVDPYLESPVVQQFFGPSFHSQTLCLSQGTRLSACAMWISSDPPGSEV
uniref:Uncharacterized protein n=1 Tax=Myotis myotis TaxID=51298 RepID=A0A7J7YDP8_MYOMY|nr:hypothetical protein mMyoMyo1_011085 [Myotis myotis]